MDETHAEGCRRREDDCATCSCGGVRLKGDWSIISWETALMLWPEEGHIQKLIDAKKLTPMNNAAYFYMEQEELPH
jgi:hypothetical protein